MRILLGYLLCWIAKLMDSPRLYYAARHSYRSNRGLEAFRWYWHDARWNWDASTMTELVGNPFLRDDEVDVMCSQCGNLIASIPNEIYYAAELWDGDNICEQCSGLESQGKEVIS